MIGFTLFKTKVQIRVLYKSGNSHSFWAYAFKFNNGQYTWAAVTQSNEPILLGPDNIEAVYQVNGRLNIFTAMWQLLTGNK